ncbi:MAG TPA: glycosyltransferase family 2 protein [Bacteroidetes bacterium]|nr:glycosyltransferase family 2 protein [Bacteroidota bacterium]
MSQPLVYIIIVNWNGKDITLDCLGSLSRLSYRNTKVVVVDNASSDGSVEEIGKRFPTVVLLEMRENLRFAGGTNAGIRYGLDHGAEMFLLLNNDTTVDPEFLSAMVERLGSSSDVGMVAPKIYYHGDPNRIWFAGGSISMWTGTMKHNGIREDDTGQFDTAREIEYTTGCCILVKREVVEKVGVLDESFSMYTEDADWSMRVRRAGYAILFEPKAKIWHKLSVSSGGHLSWYKMKNKFISNLRFFSRYAAWYHWLVFPWANILVNGYAAAKYLLSARAK